MVLVISVDSTKNIHVSNAFAADASTDSALIFFKLRPEAITLQNLHTNVLMTTMPDPVNGLYHMVQKVFAPSLLKDNSNRGVGQNVQKLLGDLEQSLGSILRKSQPNRSSSSKRSSDNDFSGILTPLDECRYWADLTMSGARLEDQERSQHFCDLLKPMEQQFTNIDSLSIGDALEVVEIVHDTLDDLWKQTEHNEYPEERMVNLFDVIGDELCRFAQKRLEGDFSSIWEGSFAAVREALRDAIKICDRWTSTCETLTSRLWKQYPTHQWKSGKYKPKNVGKVSARFQEICELRIVHEHLMRLLSSSERDRLSASDSLTKTFNKVGALHYNPYTEPMWRSAVAAYERAMNPAEDAVAEKLKRRLKDSSGKVHQLLHEFQRYKELIRRPRIAQDLTAERETLLGLLTNYAKTLRSEFKQRSRDGAPSSAHLNGKNLSEVVSNIIWAKQLEAKMTEVLKAATDLLSSLPNVERLKDACVKSRDEMEAYRLEQFQSWSEYMLSALNDPSDPVSLQNSSKVMELDHHDGRLTVHYSDRTVALLREVRQLAGLGHRIPPKLQAAATQAQKFYKHAVILKQVRRFFLRFGLGDR
uniref:Cytoplasmic dynein 2 heavy chain 1-like n=1 Tax=Phallusia mammillata TaxID=59560 RepID=A0A6F9DC51_9ASCI|nr:cytoplasmic dynein 2 heavy chain 1-like [Phallusia mammillata]